MKHNIRASSLSFRALSFRDIVFPLFLLFGGLLLAAPAPASVDRQAYPTAPPSGLQKVKSREFDTVYVKPGFNPGDYGKLIIETPVVAMDDQWERNNRHTLSDRDLQRIYGQTSEIMLKQFSDKLSAREGFAVVDKPAQDDVSGRGVLRLKPALIDLFLNDADLAREQDKDTYVRSAGFATLYLDLHDAESGELLMRVIDRDEARNRQRLQEANRATNYHDTRIMVARWAEALRKYLDDLNDGTA